MDIVDRDMEKAEVQASRTWSQEDATARRKSYEEIERRSSRRNSVYSGSSSSLSTQPDRVGMIGTVATQNIVRTRTHPLEMHRTDTHRLQHSHTVGADPSRTKSDKPLPNFGGGKPYPPPLPSQDEYVVEFDGKDDPLHPQNWPFGKK